MPHPLAGGVGLGEGDSVFVRLRRHAREAPMPLSHEPHSARDAGQPGSRRVLGTQRRVGTRVRNRSARPDSLSHAWTADWRLARIFVVGDVAPPRSVVPGVVGLLVGDLRREARGCGAVPVILVWLEVDAVTW